MSSAEGSQNVECWSFALWGVCKEKLVQHGSKAALGTPDMSPSVLTRLPNKQSKALHSSAWWEDSRHKQKWEAYWVQGETLYSWGQPNTEQDQPRRLCRLCPWRFSRPESPEQPDLVSQFTLLGAVSCTRDLPRSFPDSKTSLFNHRSQHFT